MKLTNTFDAVTISTRLTKTQMAQAKKYAPESLILMEDKKPIFAVDLTSNTTCGSVNKNGIVFSAADRNDVLYVTMSDTYVAGLSAEAALEALTEEFGIILYRLKQIEDQVELAIGIAAESIASVAASITIG